MVESTTHVREDEACVGVVKVTGLEWGRIMLSALEQTRERVVHGGRVGA
jgi:hypothetical protein